MVRLFIASNLEELDNLKSGYAIQSLTKLEFEHEFLDYEESGEVGFKTILGVNYALVGLIALDSLPDNSTVFTSSGYLFEGYNNWSRRWLENGFTRKDGLPVKYPFYWKRILKKNLKIKWDCNQRREKDLILIKKQLEGKVATTQKKEKKHG